jgi:hypothetical protein
LIIMVSLAAATSGFLSFPLLSQAQPARVGPITAPAQPQRLTFQDLKYAGAFRLPSSEANGDNFSYGGGPLAFNPARDSLFVGARSGRVAEITIPTPVSSVDVNALPAAEYLQPFHDPTEGRMKDVATDGALLAGLLVHDGRLYGTGSIYYDASNSQSISHFSRPLDLSQPGAGPMRRVWQKGRTGFVAGYLAPIPPEWQLKLGGTAITGQCCVPIVSRTSWGPAAFAWKPSDLAKSGDIDAVPLVYYTAEHATLGSWSGANPTYGGTAEMGGLVLIDGTRTALFVGRNGTGQYCYGIGTGDRALANTTTEKGEKFCYDPASADKGQHAYPYRYQMWAYDLNDWAEVAAGRRDPWEVTPYGVWPFDLPTPDASVRIAAVAFDPTRRRLFVSQRGADRDTYASKALIHVFQIP